MRRMVQYLGVLVILLGCGKSTPSLTLNISAGSAQEGDAPLQATVSVPSNVSGDLLVTLSSSDTDQATVPPTVTITDGTNSITFDVTIIDDGTYDGTVRVVITATATGYKDAEGGILVNDDDTAQEDASLVLGTFTIVGAESEDEGAQWASEELHIGVQLDGAGVYNVDGDLDGDYGDDSGTYTCFEDGILLLDSDMDGIYNEDSGIMAAIVTVYADDVLTLFGIRDGDAADNSTFNGNYHWVNFGCDDTGVWTSRGTASANGSGSMTANIQADSDGSTGSMSSAYTVQPSGRFTATDLGAAGMVSQDGQFMFLNVGDVDEAGMVIGTKRGSGMTNADVAGVYIACNIGGDATSGLDLWTSLAEVVADGEGGILVTPLKESDGTPDSPFNTIYTVYSDGRLRVADLWDGFVSPDGNLFAVADTDSQTSGEEDIMIVYGIRKSVIAGPPALSLDIPASSATEGDPPVAATISIDQAPSDDLTVSLSSSDGGQVSVPTEVVIQAGQTSETFDVTIVNDPDVDGDVVVTITATATGRLPATDTITAIDNEIPTGTFTVTISATEATEGDAPVSATLSVDNAPASDLTVDLNSSLPGRASVPSQVTILATQNSVDFDVTIVDDLVYEGDVTVTVTASATDYLSGSDDILVHDDETGGYVVECQAADEDYIDFGGMPGFMNVPGWTIIEKVKLPAVVTSYGNHMTRGKLDNPMDGDVSIQITPIPTVTASVTVGGPNFVGSGTISTTDWVTICLRYVAPPTSILELYVDGSLVDSTPLSPPNDMGNNNNVYFGGMDPGSETMYGEIAGECDIVIAHHAWFQRALDPAEIAAYDGSVTMPDAALVFSTSIDEDSVTDESGSGHDGTNHNSPEYYIDTF